jgi:hypothetical protein
LRVIIADEGTQQDIVLKVYAGSACQAMKRLDPVAAVRLARELLIAAAPRLPGTRH